MSDEVVPAAAIPPRSREQLLRVLHEEPRSVSRTEIKAAFADGRLGDQDLDIPVLAGMKRITELLAELQPGVEGALGTPADAEPRGGGSPVHGPPSPAPGVSRSAATGARVQEIEAQLDRIADRMAALEGRMAVQRPEAPAGDPRGADRQARAVRALVIGVTILTVVALLELLLRLITH